MRRHPSASSGETDSINIPSDSDSQSEDEVLELKPNPSTSKINRPSTASAKSGNIKQENNKETSQNTIPVKGKKSEKQSDKLESESADQNTGQEKKTGARPKTPSAKEKGDAKNKQEKPTSKARDDGSQYSCNKSGKYRPSSSPKPSKDIKKGDSGKRDGKTKKRDGNAGEGSADGIEIDENDARAFLSHR